MSRLLVPFRHIVLSATGDLRLWVELDLLLKDNAGNWRKETFRVDSASDLTTMPAYLAKLRDLPMPQVPTAHAKHRPTGLEIRSGFLRFQIAGMDQTEYATPCLFLGDPATPPANPAAAFARNLLQPCALVQQLRFTFDYDPTSTAVHGVLVVEKR